MDLDSSQLAFEWIVQGGLVTGIGAAPEMRTDSLVGDRAELADAGYTSGACGGEDERSPNAVGTQVLYVHQLLDCDGPEAISGGEEIHSYFESFSPAFRSFGFPAPEPPPTRYRHTRGADLLVALAWDGTTTYWLRARQLHPQTGQYFDDTYTCAPSQSRCTLMRTSDVSQRLRGEPRRESPLPQGA
jgi:hypothetical protein